MSLPTALEGVKVLDFSWALMGSLTSKQLADHGATVVKVESALRPCLSRIDKQIEASSRKDFNDKPLFSHFNSSKLSLQINMKHPRVREVIDPLLDWADIVVENFSPGTMAKLGLDYDSIQKNHKDIIMLSGSVFGQTGPFSKNWGVDGTGAALAGRIAMTGWPEQGPVTPSVPFGDVVVPYFMAATVVAAIDYKKRTGKGQYIDASMYEVCVQQMGETIVDSQMQGRPIERKGNHSSDTLFQGVFPCLRDDEAGGWIGISIFNSQQWQLLQAVLPGEDWPTSDELAQLKPEALSQLEQRIADWTSNRDRYELMHGLQAENIPAGVVQDIADTFENDPQLQHRDYLTPLEHDQLGVFGHQKPPLSMSRTPAQVKLAPALGQHNEEICKQLLGLSTQLYEELKIDNLFC